MERNYRDGLLFPEREWSTLTAGSLSLSVSDHSSGSGEVEGGRVMLKNVFMNLVQNITHREDGEVRIQYLIMK